MNKATTMNNPLKLTDKDYEILNLRRKGLTLKEIACKVFLSRRAVDYRLENLRKQADAKNDTELINYCHENGVFQKAA